MGTSALRRIRLRASSVLGLSASTNSPESDLTSELSKSQGRGLSLSSHPEVRLLEDNGFTTRQAEVLVQVLMKMTHDDMVTKSEQEIMLQQVMPQMADGKKDMIIMEKSEFSTLRAENEKMKRQLQQLKVQLADMMNKLDADRISDRNLEKSHVIELRTDHEKRMLEMRTEIMEMIAEQDRHLTQSNMKIDTEVAGLKTKLESLKLDAIKYLAGSLFTCLTVVLGFYGIWM